MRDLQFINYNPPLTPFTILAKNPQLIPKKEKSNKI